MSTITVGILGLGRLGASVGMALKRYNASKGAAHQFQTAGYDPRNYVQSAAEKNRNVVDKVGRGVYDVARDRDIIIVALPYADVQAAYREIGEAARPGAVVLDMSHLKEPSLKWAAAHLPETAYLVGVSPVLNPDLLFDGLDDPEQARADLFDNGTMILVPSPQAAKEAVELASDFASILGGSTHFMDPAEHDALVASTEALPALLGLALYYTASRARSWGDAQRLTNPSFGRATHHLEDTHPDDLRDLFLNNRQNLIHALDGVIDTLGQLRTALDKSDRSALEAALVESAQSYQQWLARRRRGRWDEGGDTPRSQSSLMSGLMGDYLAKRLKKDDKE